MKSFNKSPTKILTRRFDEHIHYTPIIIVILTRFDDVQVYIFYKYQTAAGMGNYK